MGSISRRPVAEVAAPRLTTAGTLGQRCWRAALVVGEVDDGVASSDWGPGGGIGEAPRGRGLALAALGWERLAAGKADEPALLRPVYLRPPAIGPQTG